MLQGGCECPKCQGETHPTKIPCKLDPLRPLDPLNHYIRQHRVLEQNTDFTSVPFRLYEVAEIIFEVRQEAEHQRLKAKSKQNEQRSLLAKYASK